MRKNKHLTFLIYQNEAKTTIQPQTQENKIVAFLGLLGEAGSVISEFKKSLRDGISYTNYHNRLQEELGDILWYVSTIATYNGLCLEEIAKHNLSKINERFDSNYNSVSKIYDESYPIEEQFPREFEVEFVVINDESGQDKVRILINNAQLGNDITDNSYKDDGYRFHDIFHFGYVAYLGWSPVIRKLMSIKRKSNPTIDEIEDGARAAITEELVSLYIYNHAIDHQLFQNSHVIDTEILKTIQKLVAGLEVRNCTQRQWESTILNSYKTFHELRINNGGRVLVSIKNRKLIYLGKK